MLETDARAKLEQITAASVFPTLDAATITRLLREARRVDDDDVLPSDDTEWEPSHVYALNDIIVPTIRNGHEYKATVAGTSGATEPVWPTGSSQGVADNGITWTEIGTDNAWQPTYDFNSAAAEGWRIKAGLVTNRHSFGSNAGNYNPEQVYQHCMEMAQYYANKKITTLVQERGRWTGKGQLPGAHLPWAE